MASTLGLYGAMRGSGDMSFANGFVARTLGCRGSVLGSGAGAGALKGCRPPYTGAVSGGDAPAEGCGTRVLPADAAASGILLTTSSQERAEDAADSRNKDASRAKRESASSGNSRLHNTYVYTTKTLCVLHMASNRADYSTDFWFCDNNMRSHYFI